MSKRSHTLKSSIGKTFIEKSIPLMDKTDVVLTVNGVLTGLSQTSGQSLATAIENDRTTLLALQDGTYHSWNDGKNTGNFAIYPDTLVFEDGADHIDGQPIRFTMNIIDWDGS